MFFYKVICFINKKVFVNLEYARLNVGTSFILLTDLQLKVILIIIKLVTLFEKTSYNI